MFSLSERHWLVQDPEVSLPLVLAAGLWWYGVWLQRVHLFLFLFLFINIYIYFLSSLHKNLFACLGMVTVLD